MKTTKSLAVIGAGRWGKNLIGEFDKISEIKYCYHKGSLQTSKWLNLNYPKIKTAKSLDQILLDSSIDAVIIATPIKTHYELTKKTLLAGKNVFVEKPLAATLSHAKELSRLARKKQKILFVGHIFLYHQVFKELEKISKSEKIKSIHCHWEKFGSFSESIADNLLCHDIAIAMGLAGNLKKTPKLSIQIYPLYSKGDIILAHGKIGSIDASFYINRASKTKNKSVLVKTSKNIYDWTDDKLYRLSGEPKESQWLEIFNAASTPLKEEARVFIDALSLKKSYPTDGDFGEKVVSILSSASVEQ